jgi:tryptophan halogenase
MVEMGLNLLALQWPDTQFPAEMQQRYNTTMADLYDHTRDFIIYHYCITGREDSAFWKANKHDITIPDELRFLMDMWQYKAPTQYDFTATVPLFGHISYLFIMAGHNAWPTKDGANFDFLEDEAAAKTFMRTQRRVRRLSGELPDHGEYIRWLHSEHEIEPFEESATAFENAALMHDPMGRFQD